jgi:hypothetical protein
MYFNIEKKLNCFVQTTRTTTAISNSNNQMSHFPRSACSVHSIKGLTVANQIVQYDPYRSRYELMYCKAVESL